MIEENRLQELMGFTSGLSLLYVEDNILARENTIYVLEDFFDNIVVAVDGEDGLEKFKQSKFDIIISDINMPKMNGLKMTELIREIDMNIPILILSAYNESGYFMDTIKLGVEGYLLKPLEINQFLDVLLRTSKNIKRHHENIEYKKNLEAKVIQKTKELHHSFTHDHITGIENTYGLAEYIQDEKYSSILLLDISSFSFVSKAYGRDFATKVLKRVSQELAHNLQKNSILLKAESDRFIILNALKTDKEIMEYVHQINSYFDQKNIEIDDAEININFTIGVASLNDRDNTMANVEHALESCKIIGSRFYSIYKYNQKNIEEEKETIRWLKITKEIISTDAIFPYYQPMQDLKDNKIVKYEALARALYKGEIIQPVKFLDAAKRLGLITSITKIMINKSFAYFSHKNIPFSLNITERDLLEDYLVDFLSEKSKKYGIKPQQVTLEILENITTKVNSDKIIMLLNKLKSIGYKIAIDDFGVENSNFSRLLDISIDIIKIDGIFVKNIAHNEKDKKIIKAIVSLAKSLEMSVIAEYVESKEIYEILKECGVDTAQGYYIGKPASEIL